jgi:glycerophosphoryl diester phosphodiesterase
MNVRYETNNITLRLHMKPHIVAHRGASTRERENTLPAFEMAIKEGADFIECDVRRSNDGQLIVHHDDTVGSKMIRSSSYVDLCDESRRIGYQIPRLADVLALSSERIMLDVEIKEEGYESQVLDMLRAVRPTQSFVITTFNERSIQRLKDRCPGVRCGLLLGIANPPALIVTRLRELFPIRRAVRAQADFVAPNWRLLKFGFIRRARKAALPVWVWTVNNRKKLVKFMGTQGVEAVITDVPNEAFAARAALHDSRTS